MRWLDQRVLQRDLLWEEPLPEVWAGIDEVGRGPLAGPVVAAAVVLPPGELPSSLDTLDDSKRLNARQRERLADTIKNVALSYSIAQLDPSEIDRLNIYRASMEAMKKAFHGLSLQVRFALVDGNQAPDLGCPAQAVVKGDQRVAAIAAASVLAKVDRDRQMVEADAVYPVYGFRWHKGYSTAHHKMALEVFGPCPLHRNSFLPVANAAPPSDREKAELDRAFRAFYTARSLQGLEACFSLPYVRLQCRKPAVAAFLERYVDIRSREIQMHGGESAEQDTPDEAEGL